MGRNCECLGAVVNLCMEKLKGLLILGLVFLGGAFNCFLGQTLVINEVASNETLEGIDEDGDISDWFEIYNNSEESISLDGFSFTDDISEPYKWVLEHGEIGPEGFLVVFASGKDRQDGELHTSFGLDSDGEALWMLDGDGGIVDFVHFGDMTTGKTFGRLTDGQLYMILERPTPGSTNNVNDAVYSNYPAGFYEEAFNVELSSFMGEEIRYTLDGSKPTIDSPIYGTPLEISNRDDEPNHLTEYITTPQDWDTNYHMWESPEELIDKCVVLRFCSMRDGESVSKIETRSYFIEDDFPLPVISIAGEEAGFFSTDSGIYVPGDSYDADVPWATGNYFFRGKDWEREIHLEIFDEEGSLGLSTDCGVRIHGGYSRICAQKSLKFYARDEYGDRKFDYQLLPQSENDEYKRFIIRTTMADWGETAIMDDVAHEVCRDLDFPKQNSRPAVLFINGEYWGIHSIKDRIDRHFLEYAEGADSDSVNIVSSGQSQIAYEGVIDDYVEVLDFIDNHDLADDFNYEYVKSKLDISNYIDYSVAQMFLANYDWPGNNIKLWNHRDNSGKWRWIFYDLDAAFNNPLYNMLEHCTLNDPDVKWPNSEVSTFLFRNLLKNEGFTNRFLERYTEILYTKLTRSVMLTKTFEIKNTYGLEMPRHIDRWGYPNNMNAWEEDINEKISDFIELRHCEVEDHIKAFFNLKEWGFDCDNTPDIGGIILAPNPNTGRFYILNNSFYLIRGDVSVCNLMGAEIYSNKQVYLSAFEKLHIDIEGNSPGIYILNFQGVETNVGMKFIVE